MAGPSPSILLYHEKQVAALCGQHCLNTLLQGPYFTEVDLAQIAEQLDALEASVMAESGMDSAAFQRWQKEASSNVAADGMFSIQVLSKALEHWNLSCTNLDSPDAASSKKQPECEQAFICNLQEHWLTLRMIGGSWYNFNSLYPAPEFLGTLYLTAFLATLKEQGYSIFVVKGQLPSSHPDAGSADSPGKWFTPQQAKAETKGAVKARETGYLKAALSSCLDKASESGKMVTLKAPSNGGAWGQPKKWQSASESGQEDEELAMAIAASLGQSAGASTSAANQAREEDPELAAALAASLDNGLSSSTVGLDSYEDNPELAAAVAASLEDGLASVHKRPRQSEQEEIADLAAARLAAIDPGPEPSAGPGTIDLALRLPNGERLIRRFLATNRVQDVLQFLRWSRIDVDGCSLLAFPRRVLSDTNQTLHAAGISNMETLTLQKK